MLLPELRARSAFSFLEGASLPEVAFEPHTDRTLRAIDATHLFEPTHVFVCVQPTTHVRRYMQDFFTMVSASAAP